MARTPIFFLAFANERPDELLDLKEERSVIESALADAKEDHRIQIEVIEETSFGDLLQKLIPFQDRVALIHYAGHASADRISLQDRPGSLYHKLTARQFANTLSHFKNLKLVFLNGCATQGFTDELLDKGVPAVIATSRKVNDAHAIQIAKNFYFAWGHRKGNKSVKEAFELSTASTLDEEIGPHRGDHAIARKVISDSPQSTMPWALYWRKQDPSGINWKIYRPIPWKFIFVLAAFAFIVGVSGMMYQWIASVQNKKSAYHTPYTPMDRISGIVRNVDHRPLSNVEVHILLDGKRDTSLTTDSKGGFHLLFDKEMNYQIARITLKKEQYKTFEEHCLFESWTGDTLNFQMEAELMLSPKMSWQGTYGTEAGVAVIATIGGKKFQAVTDSSGYFLLQSIPRRYKDVVARIEFRKGSFIETHNIKIGQTIYFQ
ncbi:MAG: CHAT domain-containing protein [Bacteroidota bacterium]